MQEKQAFKVLIVEDDLDIAKAISAQLESWNIKSKIATDFSSILETFEEYLPHLVLMDVRLPYFDGFYWTRKIRALSHVPILFISSVNDNMNLIMAMNMGADDYMTKPFELSLLMAKVQALLRRSYDFSIQKPLLEHLEVFLNPQNQTLHYLDHELKLTFNEFQILALMIENKNRVVLRDELMERLWKTNEYIDDNTLTVNISRLRKRLNSIGLKNFILTIPSRGYRLAQREEFGS